MTRLKEINNKIDELKILLDKSENLGEYIHHSSAIDSLKQSKENLDLLREKIDFLIKRLD